jgi:hypothetical protein
MWVWTGRVYLNIETGAEVKPILKGTTRFEVAVKYPNKADEILIAGDQASGIMEYVLKRRIGVTSSEALESVFSAVEDEKSGRKRKKRVLRDPEASKRRMSEAALRRWAKQREVATPA